MRDGEAKAFARILVRQLALKLIIALMLLAIVACYGLLSESAIAQDQQSGGYEPISSQGDNEETTESVVGNIADGRDESTTPVEGSGGMETTAAVDEAGLSEGSPYQEQTGSEAPLPEASPGPPLTESTMPVTAGAVTAMEPTAPLTDYYEDTAPVPGATPESGGLSMTAAFVAPLLLGVALIGSALLVRGRGGTGEEIVNNED